MESYIKRCIELAEESVRNNEAPFGSVVVKDGQVVAESGNATIASNDVGAHAEILVMRLAQAKFGDDLSTMEIYSNCEPCPMCAFMMRELGFKKVIYGVPSPHMGGHSRWNILDDPDLAKFLRHDPPEVIGGVLAEGCRATFHAAGWGKFLR